MQPTTQNGLIKPPVLASGQKYYGVAPRQATTDLDSKLMGMKAKDPNTNISKPVGTIPSNQSSNGLIKPPISGAQDYQNAVNKVGDFDVNNDLGYQQALQRQRQFEGGYSQLQQDRSTLPNIGGYQTNLMNIASAGYNHMAPVYESQANRAYDAATTRLGALQSAMGAKAPQQYSPGSTPVYPTSGTDINGNPMTISNSGQRYAQYQQSVQAQQNKPTLANAVDFANNFNSILPKTNLHTSPTALVNLLNNFYASNTSDPNLLQAQSSFNGAIEYYAQALGLTSDQLVSELSRTAQGQSLSSLFSNLDTRARTKQRELESASKSQNYQPPSLQQAPTTNQTSGNPVTGGDKNVYQRNADGSYTRIK